MTDLSHHAGGPDALLPPDMARACEAAGVAKASRDGVTLLILGMLAGAFVAFGALFMTVTATGSEVMPFGVARLLAGLVFSLGLILIIVGGAELFTGDVLMVMAFASGRITLRSLLRAWSWVYAGNIGGAIGTAVLAFLAQHHDFGNGAVGKTALTIATAKASLPALQLMFLAIFCNVLVCLAVWMTFAARSVTDKIMVIVLPIAAFVAAGFEHSIANLYLLPYGLAVKYLANTQFWAAIGQDASAYPALNIENSLWNILIATIGNLIGGSMLVGAVYWFVYLRHPHER